MILVGAPWQSAAGHILPMSRHVQIYSRCTHNTGECWTFYKWLCHLQSPAQPSHFPMASWPLSLYYLPPYTLTVLITNGGCPFPTEVVPSLQSAVFAVIELNPPVFKPLRQLVNHCCEQQVVGHSFPHQFPFPHQAIQYC